MAASIKFSPERERYNEIVVAFARSIPAGVTVYDVGKSKSHDYRPLFLGNFFTLDCEKKKNPDILINVENPPFGYRPCDVLLCNGVTETCNDPFALVRGCRRLLTDGGRALFGIMLTGYPVGTKADFTRFTEAGAIQLLTKSGFMITEAESLYRVAEKSYFIAKCLACDPNSKPKR